MAIVLDFAAEVTGKVTFGTEDWVPTNAVVNVYPQNRAGEADLLIASAAADAGGNFRFAVLAQGTYDLQIVHEIEGEDRVITVTETVEDVTINTPSTDLGMIAIPLLPP